MHIHIMIMENQHQWNHSKINTHGRNQDCTKCGFNYRYYIDEIRAYNSESQERKADPKWKERFAILNKCPMEMP